MPKSMRRFPPSTATEESVSGTISFVYCPRNVSPVNKFPANGAKIRFELREVPARGRQRQGRGRAARGQPSFGIAIVDYEPDGRFRGWVSEADKHVLLRRLENKEKFVGYFTLVCPFGPWDQGGEVCASGLLTFETTE
ncbi:hypothetical protein BJ508DRAFT_305264 [Ascobolus immersus RN42]|uniref:Uncharacterized protein n=1 Tax=Ascobolus immersus RN42 TaxID=1160509 RepID=A0A3N4IA68_ASCIM|nr:hypothetical protein BJ508DRAFT_305264 [Ascobolus immersus RN42]